MRQERIIEYLYKCSDAVEPKVLAQIFDVSERTIRSDIHLMIEVGKTNGFTIKKIRNQGYFLTIISDELFDNYLKTIKLFKPSASPKERTVSLALFLLLSNEYVTLASLATWLDVSSSTIKADLKNVRKYIFKYDLELVSKARHGNKIDGCEVNKRRAMIDLAKINSSTPNFTKEYLDFDLKFDEDEFKEILNQILEVNKFKVSDMVFENIVQHIKLLTYRIFQNNSIDSQLNVDQKIRNEYKVLTMQIIDYLIEKYTIDINYFEQVYLSYQLKGKITIDGEEDNEDLYNTIKEVLKEIDDCYLTTFHADQELVTALLLHVGPLLQRLHKGHQLSNPIIEDIYTQYANVFNITLKFVEMLNKKTDSLSKDEIGFLAVYFAASLEKQSQDNINIFKKIAIICTTGGGTSYLMKVKVQKMFTESKITTFSFNQLQQIKKEQYDLIISTVPISKENIDIPIIFTNNILTTRELNNIEKDALMITETTLHLKSSQQKVLSLFKKEYFKILNEESIDYLNLLSEESEKLEKTGMAEKGFKEHVLKREELIDTIYHKGIAGPHPMEQGAKTEVINVVLFKNETVYNQKKVKLMLLINVKKNQLVIHNEISQLIIQMIEDQYFEEEMNQVKSFEKFMFYIKKLIGRDK